MELESAKNGQYTIKIYGKYIHSKYNPQKESEQFIKQYETLFEENQIIVYGLGLGYHIETLLKYINRNTKIYVFEYNLELIHYCKIVNANLFQNKQIIIISSKNKGFLDEFSLRLKGIKDIIIHKPSLETIKNINDKLYRILDSFVISKYSSDKFGGQLEKNLRINKDADLLPISKLIEENINKKKRFIVVASGPSAEYEMESIKEYKESFGIIAVGSSMRMLMENDIIPDFVVITDCQDIVYNQIRGYESESIPICFLNTSSAITIEKYSGPKYVFYNDDRIEKENLKTGKTVAISALDLAIKLGSEDIIMIGQDLAILDGKTHNSTNESIYGVKDETKASETVISYNGEKIRTRKNYMVFKLQIESFIYNNKFVKFFNCSKGAWIEGAQHIDFIDYIRKKELEHAK